MRLKWRHQDMKSGSDMVPRRKPAMSIAESKLSRMAGITGARQPSSDLADGVFAGRENLEDMERESFENMSANLEGMGSRDRQTWEEQGAWVHRDGAGRQRRWPEHRLEQESHRAGARRPAGAREAADEAGAPRTASAGRSAQLDDLRSQDVVELNRLLDEDEVEVEAPGKEERQRHGAPGQPAMSIADSKLSRMAGITGARQPSSDLADSVLTGRENLEDMERESFENMKLNLEGMGSRDRQTWEEQGAWVHRDRAGRQRRWPEHRLEQESTASAGRSAQLDDLRSQDVVELNRLLDEDEVEVEAPGHGERQRHGAPEEASHERCREQVVKDGGHHPNKEAIEDLADSVVIERENLGDTEREDLEDTERENLGDTERENLEDTERERFENMKCEP
eukprot:CAMPEP_0203974704 /NCGR_PEP_ID=MMETSP0359-20131031/100238_1 /ASSEMBLY_ACC=CAM_ASM_000338 /TAXON_ID=268821 /ORGANISM="Scrippsiella Hangoei, Strain SHTV-5" /LENGTH=395 /DNA_ID=CAMNT_0050912891 /DNA_START=285 /DNA_END=1477 /DNA_ORIENTATION=+